VDRRRSSARSDRVVSTGVAHRSHPVPVPVPVLGEPWPGVPVRGRGAAARADACWVPVAPGLTPHGLRHSHKTLMDELGVPAKLQNDRMGHEDGSVQARYSHITAEMRLALLDGLTARWQAALDERRAMAARSPVGAPDRLLIARAKGSGVTSQDRLPRCSPDEPRTQFRAGLPERKNGPELVFHTVGVTGFEPTTSSSRTRQPRAVRARAVLDSACRCSSTAIPRQRVPSVAVAVADFLLTGAPIVVKRRQSEQVQSDGPPAGDKNHDDRDAASAGCGPHLNDAGQQCLASHTPDGRSVYAGLDKRPE
jgi:hypothetical protein